MAIQDIIKDVRTRVETTGKQYQDALQAYVDANKQAFNVVSSNAQSLANTEVDVAKSLYAAAQSSFEKARKDGVRKVAGQPGEYVPEGMDQIVSAYKQTIDTLVKTRKELTDVATSGLQAVRSKLTGKKAPAKTTAAAKKVSATAKKASTTAGKKASTAKKTAAKKTASVSKTASKTASSAKKATTKAASTAKQAATKSAS